MNTKKWKSTLVSSSLPLEFEVANLLVKNGFSVSGDYSYLRSISGEVKTFSVDIHSLAFPPFTNPDKVTGCLELLVECKHRRDTKKWLFLPDPNYPDYSSVTIGSTFRVMDEFSPYVVKTRAAEDFDRDLNFCYKATEINIQNGSCQDSDIRTGISQLQFALPRLVSKSAQHFLLGNIEDSEVYMFCPILVTTAELYVAKSGFSTAFVKAASSINDIAESAQFLVFFSNCPPDFTDHCSKECRNLKSLLDRPETEFLESLRRQNNVSPLNSPLWTLHSLIDGGAFCEGSLFSQFIVCQMNSLPLLISEIKRATVRTIRTRRLLR